MSLQGKKVAIICVSLCFLVSLLFVQWREVVRRAEEAGTRAPHITVPASSKACVSCHEKLQPGVIEHWKSSTHAERGIGCFECHEARDGDADGFQHYGSTIATVVTPLDCSRCHQTEGAQFAASHHAKAGDILASLDNFLAETVEGSRLNFSPHSPTPGKDVSMVNGLASAHSGCQQCHGSKLSLLAKDGTQITVDDLQPNADGIAQNTEAVAKIQRDADGKPAYFPGSWPNTGIGRLNLDGSRGSCSACHSRHDFSPRRARQPENCGKCHLGPDHPQKEIYEESKHGVAFRDLKDFMNLDAATWVLGTDYSAAPTCATCHMSGHTRNGGTVTHDPGERLSWTNRPPVSRVMNTDADHKIVTDPALIVDSADSKRSRMRDVCLHCHSSNYVDAFYKQYDDLVILYNEKFAKPGAELMGALLKHELRSPTQFDEEIEWTWFYLWHHEGRRARHGASMMAPDYTHWHGMYEVAERFYMELVPQAREIIHHAAEDPAKAEQAAAVQTVLDAILEREEHRWFTYGAEAEAERIRNAMQERYGSGGR